MTPFFARRRLRFRLALGLASGGLLTLAFPPVDVRWIAFAAMVPLLLAFRGATGRAGALIGFAFGLAFFGILFLWASEAGWIAWAGLLVSQIPFLIVFGWLGAWLARGGFGGRIAGLPLLYTGLEIARAHTPFQGFAWGSLGSTQHSGLPLLPLARAGGMWSVTLAVVAINALLAETLTSVKQVGRTVAFVTAAAVAIAPAFLPIGAAGASGRLDVAVVQGNVPEGHFSGIARGRVGPEDQTILRNHVTLTETLAAVPPDLIIWPENALDRDPFTNAEVGAEVTRAFALVGRPALIGAILDGPNGRFTNSNLLFSGDGTTLLGRYDKIHLVPFGEYVPWSWTRRVVRDLDQVPTDGIPGKAARVLRAGQARIGAVICFESSYPDLVRRFVRNGAEVIVVSTNNATFGRSPLARQHLAQSQMRAVEMGRSVVHAAISGISAVIGPEGRVLVRAGLFRPAIVRRDVTLASGETPYARYGDRIDLGLAGGGALAALAALILGLVRRRPGTVLSFAEDEGADEQFWAGAPVTATPPVVEGPGAAVEAP
jgi:apolipoprotein N-acyltransferase